MLKVAIKDLLALQGRAMLPFDARAQIERIK